MYIITKILNKLPMQNKNNTTIYTTKVKKYNLRKWLLDTDGLRRFPSVANRNLH